ncbi:copper homeostasis periplasmic binding protein CopC [Pseudaminobacter soli (ex Li et al. 2025)]|uniref:Cu resistance protein n=1 Tax=Pseudaminobacter soli (ex Li et al. 2025) TaxID=1295366 RepID=A0A2P7SGC6_9HYPH|nr:copper homeostasis periplasmic binding protein CopC [Mesorhizobium soli]PSJ61533.1 Cu resistance protein [Mesorhizobium soli]
MAHSSSSLPLVVLSSLAAVFFAGDAFAHAELVSETPAAKSMAMPAPTELKLKFSEGLELKFTGVKVVGPKQAAIETGPATLDPNDNTMLIVPLKSTLPDGKYTVDWHALSTDGHKTKGSYWFESMH